MTVTAWFYFSIALNICIEFINDSFPPIFALCDGKDHKKSRLLGATIEGEWFTTIETCFDGIETFETVKNSSSKMLQNHLKLSDASKQDVSIIVLFNNLYIIFIA